MPEVGAAVAAVLFVGAMACMVTGHWRQAEQLVLLSMAFGVACVHARWTAVKEIPALERSDIDAARHAWSRRHEAN